MDATDWHGEGPDGRLCPYCGLQCDIHLLAYIDQYDYGVGFIGGPLYSVAAAEKVLQRIRLAWLTASTHRQAWIAGTPALRFYFDGFAELPHEPYSASSDKEWSCGCVYSRINRLRTCVELSLSGLE